MVLNILLILLSVSQEGDGRRRVIVSEGRPSGGPNANSALSDPSYANFSKSRQNIKSCLIEKSSGRPRCKTRLEWARMAEKLNPNGH